VVSVSGRHEGNGMYTLYSMQRSGNSYKVRLALAQLRIPYRLVEIDILKGESRTPEFLSKNPNGQVPLLEAAPGRYLAESNAILWHLASRTPLRPEHRLDRAEALQWMFFEQHSIEPHIGSAYFWLTLVKGGRDLQQHAVEDWMEEGNRALGVMEKHLKHHRYFAANRYTVADLALQRKVGARGLRMILEDLMLEMMYHLPAQRKLRDFVVTADMVKGREINWSLLEKAG